MTGTKKQGGVHLSAAGLVVLALGAGGSPAFAAAPCADNSGQDTAISRSGRIPRLGLVTGTIGWDGRTTVTLSGPGYEVVRTVTPGSRQVQVTIAGGRDAAVTIQFGGTGGLSVSRGERIVRGTHDAAALRALLDGRAVGAFREVVGEYERSLLSAQVGPRPDDPHAFGFLLVGALVSSMSGDASAVGRARDVIMARVRGRVRAVRLDFRNCVQEYERFLLEIDGTRTSCLSAANSRDSWYARSVDRLGCEVEFMANAMAGEGQFIGCTALGAVVGD